MAYHRVVGISLGNTCSAVAAVDLDTLQPEVLTDDEGHSLVPSVISFDSSTNSLVVGAAAKRTLVDDPDNTVLGIKKELGQTFHDGAGAGAPFDSEVWFNRHEPYRFQVAGQWMMPQQVAALILMQLKKIAEKAIGAVVDEAVIGVPPYYTFPQRRALEEAAKIAGISRCRLISEPVCAVVAHTSQSPLDVPKNYMVVRLGGGGCDITVLRIAESDIQLIATTGGCGLGGTDFDDAIVSWAVSELETRLEYAITVDRHAMAALRREAEQAKRQLTVSDTATIRMSAVGTEAAHSLTLTRPIFEALIAPLVARLLGIVDSALASAAEVGLAEPDLDGVLLVGGSTRLPSIRSSLMRRFTHGLKILRSVNPDTAIASGAALLARSLPDEDSNTKNDGPLSASPDLALHLISEHSLGIAVGDCFHPLIPLGAAVPIMATSTITFLGDHPIMELPIYQGESETASHNTLVGTLRVGSIEETEEDRRAFEVTFSLSGDGQLSVQARHLATSSTYRGEFTYTNCLNVEDAIASARSRLLALMQPGQARGDSDGIGPLPKRRPRAFLCHASEDKRVVRELYLRLRGDGIDPWLDEEDLLPGQDWRLEIYRAMRSVDVVVVCLSKKSISKAGYVQKEIREALELADMQPEGSIFLIPLRFESCAVPARLDRLHRVDLFDGGGYARLVRALRFRASLS